MRGGKEAGGKGGGGEGREGGGRLGSGELGGAAGAEVERVAAAMMAAEPLWEMVAMVVAARVGRRGRDRLSWRRGRRRRL